MKESIEFLKTSIMRRIVARVVVEFLACVAAVSFVGCIIWHQVDAHLNDTMEVNVARQINTVAHSVGQQFHQQISVMQGGAMLIENGSLDATSPFFNQKEDGILMGLISPSGELVAGEIPPGKKDSVMKESLLKGEHSVRYSPERGLIFSVPVHYEDGQIGFFYKLYTNEAMLDEFNLISYDGEGSVELFDDTGALGTLTKGKTSTIDVGDFCEIPEIQEQFRKVWETVQENGNGAALVKYKNEHYFAFGSRVPNTDFLLMGYVPWYVVAGGVHYIYYIMMIAFGVLLCIIIMVSRFAFLARVKAQESVELKDAKEQADAANKAKSEFLSNMSHEIRTPINAVLGMDEMILRESKEPPILEYAENIRTAGNSLLGLVNDILDFSKIEAGKMDIIPVEYALSSVLNDLVNMIQKRAEKKGLEFIVKASPELPSVLYGDEIRLKQIVTNILTNAVKYTEKGSVTLSVDFEKQDEERILLKVSVRDTGIGIKQEDIAKLFSAFERIEEKRNRAIEGTGLGMNITKRLLALMDSRLEVESVYGEGSVFSFQLVQKVMNREPMGDFEESHRSSLREHKEYHESFIAPEARILVVDDTVMNIMVIKGLLKQTKVQIDTAESGYEGLKLASRTKYDIIFLDHRMPGLDGIETLQRMQAMEENPNADTPVISLTANAVSGAREIYIRAGFDDYLTKPINSSQLEAMMLKYLPAEKISTDVQQDAPPEPDTELPGWLKEAGCLNLAEGVKHCGSAAAFMDALTVFAESVQTGADEIEGFFKNKDWENYTVKVHALKSTARVIGAEELSEKARRLENAGVNGYLEEISQDTPGLLALYRTYLERLAPLRKAEPEPDAVEKTLIDRGQLIEAYETIRELISSFDYDSLQFVLDSLAQYRLPREEQARYQALRQAAAVPDWERLKEVLKD